MDLILVTRLHGTRSHEAKVKILHEFAAKERSGQLSTNWKLPQHTVDPAPDPVVILTLNP
jgi:hypothetical protein